MKIENLKAGMEIKNYKELCKLIEIEPTDKANNQREAQFKELGRHVKYHKPSKRGHKIIIDEIYEVIQEKTRKGRSDKGSTRNEYDTIKEQFKPLIYSLIISKPNHTYTGSFNNWMEYSKITTQAWGHMNIKYNEGQITNKELNDFFRIEGKSLNHMFQSTLASMENDGSIDKHEVRIAVIDNRDIIEEFGDENGEIPFSSYKILEGEEKTEIDNIEGEICKRFGVKTLSDLAYGNKEKNISRDLVKLKKFKNEFNSILLKKYGYNMCFKATKVSIKDESRIQEFKEKYGITEDMQKVVMKCKDKIYESRLKRAINRYEKPITTAIGSWYETDELLKELKEERDNNLCNWNSHYKKYIHNKK